MSKKAVVEGEVMVRTEAKTVLLDLYSETFILDDSVKTIAQARSVIKNGLLHDRLSKKIKNYKRFRTYEVVSFEDTNEQAEQSGLNKLLVEASGLDCIPENLDIYSSAEGKEKALGRAIETKKKRGRPAKQDAEDQGFVD